MVTGHAQAARDPAAGLGQRSNLRLTSVLVSGADGCSSVGDYYFNPPVQLPPMATVVIGNWILFTITRGDDAASVNPQLCQSSSY